MYLEAILVSMLTIIIASILVVYLLFTQTLEWMHLMEMIESHWPKALKFLLSTRFRVVLLVVAIGLCLEGWREHFYGHESKASAPKSDCSSGATGPSTAQGNGNIASSGNCNAINPNDKQNK